MADTIADRLQRIRARMDGAAERSGRTPGQIELVAVSKTFPAEAVREAARCGQTVFGESRVQEAVAKIPELDDRLDWHFIGHLQKNKIRRILPLCSTYHGIDTLDLARQVDRIAAECGVFPRVYLEVNVAGDSAKFGLSPEAIRAGLDEILALPRIQAVGLMTIPPLSSKAEDSRRHFAALRELRDELAERSGVSLDGLSMGMSEDFEIAIEEGATIVRIGRAAFGPRSQWKAAAAAGSMADD